MNSNGWKILTAMHMTVDGLCACSLFSLMPLLDANTIFVFFWLYNCIAFLSQPFVGLFLDKIGNRIFFLVLSVALLLLGAFFDVLCVMGKIQLIPYTIAILLGSGNSIFHIYGGKYVTDFSRNRMSHLGVFVSTGAFGLFLGQRAASYLGIISIMLILVLLSLLMLRIGLRHSMRYYSNSNIYYSSSSSYSLQYSFPLFAFVLFVVFFRSFIGKMIPYEARYVELFPLYACALAVLGKATGGYIAEWFGVGRTLYIMLMIAGICFLLGYYDVVYILAMILFINFSMPITLHIANRCFPHHQGFAFGMLAAVLIPGYALGSLCVDSNLAYHLLYPLISTIIIESLVLIVLRERSWKVLAMSVIINILTNVPLNLYVWFCITSLSVQQFVLFESIVVIIEFILYYFMVRDVKKAFVYSFLCNLVSCLLGLLYQSVIQ